MSDRPIDSVVKLQACATYLGTLLFALLKMYFLFYTYHQLNSLLGGCSGNWVDR